jgi:hypothetical protein
MHFLTSCLLAASAAVLFGCGSSSPSGSADAAPEAAPQDAAADASCIFGGCNGGDASAADATSDVSSMCDQLKMQVDQTAIAARACNPNQTQQCSGTTQGICCMISVSPGTATAVDDYDHAVAAYKASCPFDCSRTNCPTNVPSGLCDAPMGSSMGICE